MVKKVWTFMSDLPILLEIVQIFFSKKIWRQLTLPTYDLAYVLNFVVFFLGTLPLGVEIKFCVKIVHFGIFFFDIWNEPNKMT